MEIIRDEECAGLMMIPLLHQWGVKRCNYEDCTKRPNTIIVKAHPQAPVFGLCEQHFQQGNKPGGTNLKLVFDNSDLKKEEVT